MLTKSSPQFAILLFLKGPNVTHFLAASLLQNGLGTMLPHPPAVGKVVPHQILRELDDAIQDLVTIRMISDQLLDVIAGVAEVDGRRSRGFEIVQFLPDEVAQLLNWLGRRPFLPQRLGLHGEGQRGYDGDGRGSTNLNKIRYKSLCKCVSLFTG